MTYGVRMAKGGWLIVGMVVIEPFALIGPDKIGLVGVDRVGWMPFPTQIKIVPYYVELEMFD